MWYVHNLCNFIAFIYVCICVVCLEERMGYIGKGTLQSHQRYVKLLQGKQLISVLETFL